MSKKYEWLEIEVLYLQEEIVRTSPTSSPTYGNDEDDNWGDDIWD